MPPISGRCAVSRCARRLSWRLGSSTIPSGSPERGAAWTLRVRSSRTMRWRRNAASAAAHRRPYRSCCGCIWRQPITRKEDAMTQARALPAVHLVGSIGLGTVEEVFTTVGKLLGPHLRRVPDGEVGGRRMWITWQYPVLRGHPSLRPDPSGAVRPTNRFPLLTLAEDADAAALRFGELGYAREARASYLDFLAARESGVLPA